jgi:hypothetical protein
METIHRAVPLFRREGQIQNKKEKMKDFDDSASFGLISITLHTISFFFLPSFLSFLGIEPRDLCMSSWDYRHVTLPPQLYRILKFRLDNTKSKSCTTS